MVTIEQVHKEVLSLKRAVEQIRRQLEAERLPKSEVDDEARLELADDLVAEIEVSRKRKHSELIPHEAVMKRYGLK